MFAAVCFVTGTMLYLAAAYIGLAMGGVVSAPYPSFGGLIFGLAPLVLSIIGTKLFDWGMGEVQVEGPDDIV